MLLREVVKDQGLAIGFDSGKVSNWLPGKNGVRGVVEVKNLPRVGLKESGRRGIRYGEHRQAFSIVWLCSQCLAEFPAYI